MQKSSHLQAHCGWDQQSLGRHPTRRAKAPSDPAAGISSTRLVYQPSGSDWSCIGWGPPPSPGRGLVQRWDPATQTSSIWSLSSQPARQERERGGGETVSVQSRCFGTHSAPLRKHVVSRVLRVSINPLLWGFSPPNYPDNTPCCRDCEGENISLQTQTRNSRKQSGTFDCFCKRSCT